MNNRRKFIKTTLMATAGVVTSTQLTPVFSKEPQLMEKAKTDKLSSFPKGIIYTKENPGKWEKKVKSHLPVVTIKGEKVTVETKHGMSEKHYIVGIQLYLPKGKFLERRHFPLLMKMQFLLLKSKVSILNFTQQVFVISMICGLQGLVYSYRSL